MEKNKDNEVSLLLEKIDEASKEESAFRVEISREGNLCTVCTFVGGVILERNGINFSNGDTMYPDIYNSIIDNYVDSSIKLGASWDEDALGGQNLFMIINNIILINFSITSFPDCSWKEDLLREYEDNGYSIRKEHK